MKKVKGIAAPDLHTDEQFLLESYEGLNAMLNAAGEVDFLVIQGDLFHSSSLGSTSVPAYEAYSCFIEPIAEFAQDNPDTLIIVMPGNHDLGAHSDGSMIDLIPDVGKIVKIDEITTYVDDDLEIVFGCIPWAIGLRSEISNKFPDSTRAELDEKTQDALEKEVGQFKEVFEENPNYLHYICGHYQISGWEIHGNAKERIEISEEALQDTGADLITAAHVHRTDKYYTGILYQRTLNDKGVEPGYKLIEWGDQLSCDFVPLPTAKYSSVEVESENDLDDLEDDRYTEIILSDECELSYEEVASKFSAARIRDNREEDSRESKREDVIGASETKSDKELVISWLENQDIEVDDIYEEEIEDIEESYKP